MKILAGEQNPEWRGYYNLLWYIGGSQSDMAGLSGEHVDRQNRIISYNRGKTGSPSQLRFGNDTETVLGTLPRIGPLFPHIARMKETDRAIAFTRRCRLVGVSGVTLHCYRYSWAERAKTVGYAVTSYGSQGKTVDYVLFSDSTVKAATNAQQWYVSISRGRRGVRIFTPDKEQLRENVSRSGHRPLALELADDFVPRRGDLLWDRLHGYMLRFGQRAANIFCHLKTTQRKNHQQK